MEPLQGFEPWTYSLQVSCSTTELKRQYGQCILAVNRLLKQSYYSPHLPARTRQTSVGLAEQVRSGGPASSP